MNLTFKLGHAKSGQSIVARSLSNPHVFISGQSGKGKSYFLKKLVNQAVEQGATCIVFDCSHDYSEFVPSEDLPFLRLDVTSPALQINPLVGMNNQSVDVCAQQLLSLMRSVFRFGPRAATALRQTAREFLTSSTAPTLSGLLDFARGKETAGRGLTAALEPLELLNSLIYSGSEPINIDLTTPGLVVLDFQGVVDYDLRKFLVELLLQTIWNVRSCVAAASAPPLILVLDEAQQLSWGQNSMSIRILREGRKFGIGGWFSTQWLGQKDAVAALGQATLRIHFKPEEENIEKLAKALCQSPRDDLSQCKQLIGDLQVGQFVWQRPGGQWFQVNVGE